MTMQNTLKHPSQAVTTFVFCALAALCLLPVISSPIALILGLSLASIGLVPKHINTTAIAKKLLAYSIVGLGFGINVNAAIEASQQSIFIVVGSIVFTLLLGFGLTRSLHLDKKTGHLIAAGTSICGGSAIAAVAPAINARDDQTSVALATIFLLNSIALFVFPAIGHALDMSQHDFGLWSAIAIHDTSSVVGAASAYGDEALKTATTVKLARALWIIPVALLSALLFKGDNRKLSIPYFIIFYCFAIAITDWFPAGEVIFSTLFDISKRTLVLCLFLIGSGITVNKLRAAGHKPLLLGVLLWMAIGGGSLAVILL